MSISEGLLLSAERISRDYLNIRTKIDEKIEDGNSDKFRPIYAWPNSYIVNQSQKEELSNLDIEVVANKPFLGCHSVLRTTLKSMDQTRMDTVDYLKFRHLRNYFSVTRLLNNFDEDVKITLEYREINLSNFSDNMNIGNDDLMDYLINHEIRDEITWRIDNDNTKQKSKLHYTLTNLFFQMENKWDNKPIELFKKEPQNEFVKSRNYYLTKDQHLYERVVEQSFERLGGLVLDDDLYANCKNAYNKYKVN